LHSAISSDRERNTDAMRMNHRSLQQSICIYIWRFTPNSGLCGS
jgi:hypothetical protein